MNLDNINTENRTSTMMNQRPLRNRRVNRNLTVRCCSFCRQPGHNINLCNDQRLQDFENLCRNKKREYETHDNPVDSFQEWVYQYWAGNEQIIKAYAVSRCGGLMRHRIFDLIENIMIHFYGDEYILGDLPPPLVSDSDSEDETLENIINTREFLSDYRTFMMMMRILTQPDLHTASERKFAIQSNLDKIESQEICDCNICFEEFNVTNFVKLNCNHAFCKECIKSTLKSCNILSVPVCALCRAPIKKFTFKNNDVQSEFTEMII